MIASEFLEVYPRTMADEDVHHDTEVPIVRKVQRYSYAFGQIVHAAMLDEHELIPELLGPAQEFENGTSYPRIEREMMASENGWRHRNEVNFYCLNEHMTELWHPLTQGGWFGGDRTDSLNATMNSLGLMGMNLFQVRANFIKQQGTEALYDVSEENQEFVDRFTGALQEIDAAIIAISAIRRLPNLTVVPAPLQFERRRRTRGKNTNADLLVIDPVEKRMLGIQVKTRLTERTRSEYDTERIIFIDGDTDLGNIRDVRVKNGTSKKAIKPWPGIVATSQVHNIKMHGKHQHVPSSITRQIVSCKILARELIGPLKITPSKLSQPITERIKHAI